MGLYPSTSLWPSTGLYPEAGGEIPPTVTTGTAVLITETSSSLGSLINPNSLQTHYCAEYGITDTYGSNTPTLIAGTAATSDTFYSPASGLTSGHLYHFRVVAWSAAGTAYGADRTFITEFGPNDPHVRLVQDAGRGQ